MDCGAVTWMDRQHHGRLQAQMSHGCARKQPSPEKVQGKPGTQASTLPACWHSVPWSQACSALPCTAGSPGEWQCSGPPLPITASAQTSSSEQECGARWCPGSSELARRV